MNHNGTSLTYMAVAFALCAVIGLEREYRQRSAGLRTHVLVGLGSAVFMLVAISPYRFTDVLGLRGVALDPSRVAAQIMSGIGFFGGGLIFVRRDAVRGLTTAASVWPAASTGAAAGAGLRVGYPDGQGLLRETVRACTEAGFRVSGLHVAGPPPGDQAPALVGVRLELSGRGTRDDLIPRLSERPGVSEVALLEDDAD